MSGVSVLYFAGLRDLAGRGSEDLSLPAAQITVARLRELLEARHAALRGRLTTVRFAVNEEFAEESSPIVAGDVVALIPPVSGG